MKSKRDDLILGKKWLAYANLKINWRTSKLEFNYGRFHAKVQGVIYNNSSTSINSLFISCQQLVNTPPQKNEKLFAVFSIDNPTTKQLALSKEVVQIHQKFNDVFLELLPDILPYHAKLNML